MTMIAAGTAAIGTVTVPHTLVAVITITNRQPPQQEQSLASFLELSSSSFS